MIAHRASWRYALLAVAILVGAVVAFARGSSGPSAPSFERPAATERIDDGHRDVKPPRFEREPRGILEDTPVEMSRHDRGF